MINIEQERGYYDRQYAQFLNLPAAALRTDRETLGNSIRNPSCALYERRLLYSAAMLELQAASPAGKRVLDYGCGPADFGIWLATEGADVTVLDLSPVAVELATSRARASGVSVRGIAADAAQLRMLRDGEFDLVFACAALHHTLKYRGAIDELARIMRPGARLVLCETWGHNRLLNGARRLRAFLAGEADAQGEGIILSYGDLKKLEPFYADIRVVPWNLFAMGKRMLRGRFHKVWARSLVHALEQVDSVLLSAVPPLRRWCGEAIITATRAASG